jgi:hypothetical protein
MGAREDAPKKMPGPRLCCSAATPTPTATPTGGQGVGPPM